MSEFNSSNLKKLSNILTDAAKLQMKTDKTQFAYYCKMIEMALSNWEAEHFIKVKLYTNFIAEAKTYLTCDEDEKGSSQRTKESLIEEYNLIHSYPTSVITIKTLDTTQADKSLLTETLNSLRKQIYAASKTIYHFIFQTLSAELWHSISSVHINNNCYDLFRAIKDNVAPLTQTTGFQLKQELLHYKRSSTLSMRALTNALQKLHDDLKAAPQNPDSDVLFALFFCLTDAERAVIMRELYSDPNFRFAAAAKLLIAHEDMLSASKQSDGSQDNPITIMAIGSPACAICGNKSHTTATCVHNRLTNPDSSANSASNSNRKKPVSETQSQSKSKQAQFNPNKYPYYCTFCQKPGHSLSRCENPENTAAKPTIAHVKSHSSSPSESVGTESVVVNGTTIHVPAALSHLQAASTVPNSAAPLGTHANPAPLRYITCDYSEPSVPAQSSQSN